MQRLSDDRLHLHHGPIDIVLRCWGDRSAIAAAEAAAMRRFPEILPELITELPLLRQAICPDLMPKGLVARRMHAACLPFARQGIFITAMAAVAGAVADELLAVMRKAAPSLTRAFVNNGGDIAVFVTGAEALHIGLAAQPEKGGIFDGALCLRAEDGIGGIATSGRHGRSFSLGIADAVTTLADSAAAADAAATVIANAVDIQSPAIQRAAAASLDPDSDLGERLVTTQVGTLSMAEINAALAAGAAEARHWQAAGLLQGAALRLAGTIQVTDARLQTLPRS